MVPVHFWMDTRYGTAFDCDLIFAGMARSYRRAREDSSIGAAWRWD
jgi:hypothetical protein